MNRSSINRHPGAAMIFVITAGALGCGTNDVLIHDGPAATGGGGGMSGGTTATSGAGGGGWQGEGVPLGPADWLGPTLLWTGKEAEAPECPPSAPVKGAFVFNDLNAPTLCGACKCDVPSGACTLPTTLTAAAAACPGNGPGVPHTSFDAPAGWDGSCSAASPIPANQKCNGVSCVQSLTIAPLTLTEEPCAVSTEPVAAKLPYTWATAARTCRGVAFGPCSTPAEVCAPPVEPGFEQCLIQNGERECPAPYTIKHVFYYGFEDTRACTPCACGAPSGGTCSASVSVFKDASCTAPVFGSYGIDSSGPKCLDVLPGVALGSKLATAPVYAPGACQVSGGEPMGEAVPAEPSTFCCLPPGT